MNIGIILVTGPYQFEASDTVIQFVKAALKKGHTITGIFLFMDGVYNMNNQVNPAGERNVIEMINALGETVPITACGACAQFRGMKNAVDNVRIGGLGELVTLVQTCDRVITFGG